MISKLYHQPDKSAKMHHRDLPASMDFSGTALCYCESFRLFQQIEGEWFTVL
jgi:hypothetical protein